MAITTENALKAVIESLGLGLSAYRRYAPSDAVLPYVILTGGISETTVSGGDAGAEDSIQENVQADLYENIILNGEVVESQVLKDDLRRLLHGYTPSASQDLPTRIFGIRVPFRTTAATADDNLVRTRMSVNVNRAI